MTRLTVSVGLAALFLLLAACAAQPPEPEETPVQEEGRETATPTATSRPESSPTTTDPYPLPPTPTPLAEEGYPASGSPPTSPPPTAYPADMRIWVLHPQGYQCEEGDGSEFASEEEAVASLTSAGVEVFGSETVNLIVCEACGCPTSAHYRVQILRSDLPGARMLGWVEES